ncbi:hypothetical protein HHK36_012789 [Tetracentron sinense]|uniref:C2H2-type domain-containing protein n=1 Tax=Tetracentron sinense TaxID=13715 RepID=A0A834ZFX7_TETSI|nr:hypothetical protein HHK36_012789 [Tetracentron sinense]
MESGQHEVSKTSTDESDQPDQFNHDVGTGRSYECVFCKRGFTTAQALGGHMNIHRKDRARISQPAVPSVTNKPGDEYASAEFHPSISSHPPQYSASAEAQRNYHKYFPAATSSTRHTDDSKIQKPRPSGQVGEDWRTSLSLRIGSTRVEGNEEDEIQDGKEDELDLELRLGHGR